MNGSTRDTADNPPRYSIANFDDMEPNPCPCGSARRAFASESGGLASMHVVRTQSDARVHYHKKMTEMYYILMGEGHIELDGTRYPARPGMAFLIQPLCRHRLIGTFEFLNVPVPAFDASDEWFD